MEKNWLIRTKNNRILGPVSKDKIRELLNNGSIQKDDEVCSGNGYWFYIREKELVEKYILKDIPQDFNPVCEAQTVLARESVSKVDDDKDDITIVGMNLNDLNSAKNENDDITIVGLSLDDLNNTESDYENVIEQESNLKLMDKDKRDVKNKNNLDIKKNIFSTRNNQNKLPEKSTLNSNRLYILIIIFMSLVLFGFYYKKKIVERFLSSRASFQIISPSFAQVNSNFIEKKN